MLEAMRLLIFRHAKAEKGAPGTRDRDRPLNPRGRKDAPRMGAYMARHTLVPDLRPGVAGAADARDLGGARLGLPGRKSP